MEHTLETTLKPSRLGKLKVIALAAVTAFVLGAIAALATKAFADSPKQPAAISAMTQSHAL